MVNRRFILGSEWLFCKIYTGEKIADLLLTKEILPMAVQLRNDGLVDNWFFIRYNDSDGFHIRLRFRLSNNDSLHTIISSIYSAFNEYVTSGTVKNIVYDTYVREIERYGSETYNETEGLFCVDSMHILNILSCIAGGTRWMYALPIVDDMLDAFGLDLTAKCSLVRNCRDSFRMEFGFTDIRYIRQLNDKYRKDKHEVQKIMNRHFPEQQTAILEDRKKWIIDYAKGIKLKLSIDFNSYISSLTHMSMNRLFMSDNRLCEMIVYDYLFRYYDSMSVRKRLCEK